MGLFNIPPHLKQWGVHNVFHSSLLRIHIPSNDRLFPGRMDTQVAVEDHTDDEWAVDFIKSHSGSKSDAIFEVHWKSGDVTWLPYYQITHLQALTDYLDLLGVTWISSLPKGTGHPPADDPQIFLGSMALVPTHNVFPSCSFSVSPILAIKDFIVSIFSSFSHSFSTFTSINIVWT